MYHYSNFKAEIGTKAAEGLVCIIPENNSGYDNRMYNAYFTVSTEQTSGTVMGSYAISFVNAVNKLPETVTRFDEAAISAAIDAYNALEDRDDELAFIDEALIEKFQKSRSEYYVSVAEGMIERLFGMYNNEYCFNKVKEARESLLALTEAEQAQVANKADLDAKITALATAMGVELDFTKTYAEHFPTEEPPIDPPTDDPTVDDKNNDLLVIILIVAGAVVVLAAAGVAAFMIIKKKKQSANEVASEPVSELTEESVASEETDGSDSGDGSSAEDSSTEVKDN
jgi:hypothetical protein